MKKWYIALMLAIVPVLAFTISSCSDDNDLPDVSVSLELSKGALYDGTIYVVQGDTIDIESIVVINNESNKNAAVTNVNYYWDGYYYAPSVFYPYGMVFPTTENTQLGDHTIGIACTVLAVDKSIATATISYPVKVVASADEMPAEAVGGKIVNTTSLK